MREKNYRIENYKGIWKVTHNDGYECYYQSYKDAYVAYNNYYVSVDPVENKEEIELRKKAKARNEKIDLILGE